jgi:hypothetical protein
MFITRTLCVKNVFVCKNEELGTQLKEEKSKSGKVHVHESKRERERKREKEREQDAYKHEYTLIRAHTKKPKKKIKK